MISSGDGGVFPAGLLVGHVAMGTDRRLRVRLSADYERLEFLRVLRSHPGERVLDPGGLIVTTPLWPRLRRSLGRAVRKGAANDRSDCA